MKKPWYWIFWSRKRHDAWEEAVYEKQVEDARRQYAEMARQRAASPPPLDELIRRRQGMPGIQPVEPWPKARRHAASANSLPDYTPVIISMGGDAPASPPSAACQPDATDAPSSFSAPFSGGGSCGGSDGGGGGGGGE